MNADPNPYATAEYQHSMLRRARFHNYREPGLYLLTMVTTGRQKLFGDLMVTDHPFIKLTPLGKKVYFEQTRKIPFYYPNVEVWRICMMPDHIHMIVYVKEKFADGLTLGNVVAGFKNGCNKVYKRRFPTSTDNLFEKGYNDRILKDGAEQLKRWKRYLADNPRRLYLKRKHPELFSTLHNVEVAGRKCQLFGNPFLLDIPDKTAVIVHRRDTDEEYALKFKQWLACGERGGVLVSAAVSPREKAVMREAMNRGYCIIRLADNGFAPLYKPPGEFFDACARGQLLEISPLPFTPNKGKITREECLALNALAEEIADGRATPV